MFGYPYDKFQIFYKEILVDLIRPSLGRIYIQKLFFKTFFGALSKIGDQIQKYVVNWCDTSQLVQQLQC